MGSGLGNQLVEGRLLLTLAGRFLSSDFCRKCPLHAFGWCTESGADLCDADECSIKAEACLGEGTRTTRVWDRPGHSCGGCHLPGLPGFAFGL